MAAFTIIHVGPSFMIEDGYNRAHPYCVGVVELEEGPRVDARTEGVESSKPEEIKIGIPMRVNFLHRGEDKRKKTYLAFEPV